MASRWVREDLMGRQASFLSSLASRQCCCHLYVRRNSFVSQREHLQVSSMPATCWHVGEKHFIDERITIAICFFCSLRSTCMGTMPMDENIQHDITQICITLLQKSA